MNVPAVLDARSANEQLDTIRKVACSSLKLLQGVRKTLPRPMQKELKIVQTCMDAQGVALQAQNDSFKNIDRAGSTKYVMNSLKVDRKRKDVGSSHPEAGHGNGSALSDYEQMRQWEKRYKASQKIADIAENVTPCRELRKHIIRGHAGAQQLEMCENDANESVAEYAARLKKLEPDVQRTAEECVRMLAVIPKDGTNGKRHSVALAWEKNKVRISERYTSAVGGDHGAIPLCTCRRLCG